MSIIETITWHAPEKEMPDDGETVLLHLADDDVPIWPGYHDGDQGWLTHENLPAPRVLAWASMPMGVA